MRIPESQELEKALQKPDIHHAWENSYRTEENIKFYNLAFDYIADVLKAPPDATLLDAGCGICDYSIRMAKRGFSIVSVDFSQSVLQEAEANISSSGFKDKITLRRENILSLSFDNESFDYILCWGVLMHIPDIELAIYELNRVLKKGGTVVISEGNMSSLESIMMRKLKRILGKQKDDVIKTAAGLEHWAVGPTGKLLSRQADIRWLKEKFESSGFVVKKHVSGQFTELYNRFSSKALIKMIHLINNLWFKYINIPTLAYGNIIIFTKRP